MRDILLRAEIALTARRRMVRPALALLAIMLLVSGIATAREQWMTQAAVASLADAERMRWLDQTAKNPHRAAHYGLWVSRPPSPLAVIDPGTAPFVGQIIRVEAHQPGEPLFRTALDSGPFRTAGMATMTDLIVLLAPLAAILMGFSSLATDRERGTLRLAVGAGGDIGRLAWTRFVAAGLLLGGTLAAPMAIIGMAAVRDAASMVALAGLIGAVLLYTATFLAVATAISLRARTSRGALTCMLALWTIGGVIAPRLATATVEHWRPTPSDAAMREQVERINADWNAPGAAAARRRRVEASLAGTGRTGQVDVGGVLFLLRDRHDNAVYDAASARLSEQVRAQDRLLTAAGLLTPAIAFQQLADALAGSGSEAQIAFHDAAERYRRTMSNLMNTDLMRHPGTKDRPHVAGDALFRALPRFVMPRRGIGAVIADGAVAAGLLLSWLAAGLTALRFAARGARP